MDIQPGAPRRVLVGYDGGGPKGRRVMKRRRANWQNREFRVACVMSLWCSLWHVVTIFILHPIMGCEMVFMTWNDHLRGADELLTIKALDH